ncbi:hypothetical protein NEIMUCOT_04985 [Neisseria mucosa ATCC 25996]|uniref:Uncharacterized protein n=1 Tax=Neisseria mucosa (strain ATCC 25996 / DSM 4631 / NCTC 10774 / M26) TaxID=546266 RepID=D2ZWI8_NEIM2|nr:hypothetical protein NEIMUCOT_04985 [Neisseria mucosa ATCC 25996]
MLGFNLMRFRYILDWEKREGRMVMGLGFRRPDYHLSDWQNING